ncbi:DUF502 domain-containing protein [Aquabacterium sp. A7-Y]|uniref:DUF502 domain-containing protein n=1 Tax=Aquabacterium sp. A7-Y TaxID=1349605 RepID=UPI00223DE747|nr:DUF502 domain-containing protein [Aquabacterium sp. A7-Y]MCW7537286.1 DUF502 domain-containing protein [Aquabacterium sp. A7-Y]
MKKYFITGLLVWLPVAITIWVLLWVVGLFDGVFAALVSALQTVAPASAYDALHRLKQVPGLGLVLVAAGMFMTGVFVANIFGQWWLKQWERALSKIPIVKSIYSSVKQVSDTLFSSSGNAFREAVLIQYPRQGSWTIAFVTGAPGGEVAQHLDPRDFLSVYVPTTPNPTSGFFLMLPRAEVVDLKMSVDEALKYTISMGVVAPPAILDSQAQPLVELPRNPQG